MDTSEFETSPNNLHTAANDMIDKKLADELSGLADLNKNCPHPEHLDGYKAAMKKFTTSRMTSTDISTLQQESCPKYNCCKYRDKCMRVLADTCGK